MQQPPHIHCPGSRRISSRPKRSEIEAEAQLLQRTDARSSCSPVQDGFRPVVFKTEFVKEA